MPCLNVLGYGKRDLAREVGRIRSASEAIDRRLSELRPSDASKIGRLGREELEDLETVVGIADLLVAKYSERKEMREILGDFAGIVHEAAGSLEAIDDEVAELIVSTEGSIGRIREMHTRISAKSDLGKGYRDGPDYDIHQTSGINLTNSVTEINTAEYQQSPQGKGD